MGEEKSAEEIKLETAKIQAQTARMQKRMESWRMAVYGTIAGITVINIAYKKGVKWPKF